MFGAIWLCLEEISFVCFGEMEDALCLSLFKSALYNLLLPMCSVLGMGMLD